MFLFLVMTTILLVLLLVGVTAVRPEHSPLSLFELERRSGRDANMMDAFRREGKLLDILSFQRVIGAVLLVTIVPVSLLTFGPLLGICLALLVALEYGALARIPFMGRVAQKVYVRSEPALLEFIERVPWFFKLLRNIPSVPTVQTVASHEELQHIITESSNVLSPDEKKLLTNGLVFGDKIVRSIMTPRSMIDSIHKSEFLGPLTLDDLHKTGHSRLPVIDGDIDHVVGMLHIKSLLALDQKRSVTAEKAMEPIVYYIREDQTLHHALAAFLRTHHHLFIVVNEYRETVGLLALEDVIEALLGRKIVDEFDAHDDLRVVAQRNPRGNNEPRQGENV